MRRWEAKGLELKTKEKSLIKGNREAVVELEIVGTVLSPHTFYIFRGFVKVIIVFARKLIVNSKSILRDVRASNLIWIWKLYSF